MKHHMTVSLFMTMYTEQVNEHPVGCTQRTSSWIAIYTEQVNEHPVGCTQRTSCLHWTSKWASCWLYTENLFMTSYLHWASKWAYCWLYTENLFMTIYTEQVNEHPVVVHREPHIYTEQVNHPVGCEPHIYTEQVNEHPVGCRHTENALMPLYCSIVKSFVCFVLSVAGHMHPLNHVSTAIWLADLWANALKACNKRNIIM